MFKLLCFTCFDTGPANETERLKERVNGGNSFKFYFLSKKNKVKNSHYG